MPKNIVICCDGTGNEFGNANSNVVKLFSTLTLDPKTQVAYYDPGIGTMGANNALTGFTKWITKTLGLAFGYGLLDNVGDAYRFLMQNWEPGDKLYLFGFSRGAFTVRVLASVLYLFGLLPRDNQQLTPYILRSLKRMDDAGEGVARRFKTVFFRGMQAMVRRRLGYREFGRLDHRPAACALFGHQSGHPYRTARDLHR